MSKLRRATAENLTHVNEGNRRLIERALEMRCVGYLAHVKAELLTKTIYEMDISKKALKFANLELAQQADERRRAEQERRRLVLPVLHTPKPDSLGVPAGGLAHDFNNILLTILRHVHLVLRQIPRRPSMRESV